MLRASSRSLAPMSIKRSDILLSSAEKRSVSLETMPLTPFAKTTWRFKEARLLMPPALWTRRKPCSSASSTTKPMWSMCAQTMMRLPFSLPARTQMRLPSTSVRISSQYGRASSAMVSRTASSRPEPP